METHPVYIIMYFLHSFYKIKQPLYYLMLEQYWWTQGAGQFLFEWEKKSSTLKISKASTE